jgi:hypothetical protein
MAVVSAPLLSFTASGQIAKTQVYANWKGRPYVRRLVVPNDPKTTDQMTTRNAFSFLSNAWRTSPADFRAPWTAYAKGQVMTDRNAWLKKNIAIVRLGTNLDDLVLSPGAAGGLAADSVPTGGAGTITTAIAAPSPLPPGWTVVKAVAAAILDQDGTVDTDYTIYAASDSSSPYSVVISGLTAGLYQTAGWLVYQRSSNVTDLAYGPGIAEHVTVS